MIIEVKVKMRQMEVKSSGDGQEWMNMDMVVIKIAVEYVCT
jgi:hypothetical protein